MSDKRNTILQNLKDADCNQELINKFFQLGESGKLSEQLRLLSVHRKNLLNKLHLNQKQIDYLDYLIYSLEQNTL